MEPTTNKTYTIVIAIVVIILIILGIYSFTKRSGNETFDGKNTLDARTTPTENYSLTVDDQFPGTVVYVSTASLKKAGFVVIHKNVGGKAGAVIGSKAFTAGTNPGQVDLTEATIEDQSYFAMIHEDNGDGVFDAATDMAVKDAMGREIMVRFNATTKIVEQKG